MNAARVFRGTAADRVELATLFPFGTGKLPKEIFIDPAQYVAGEVLFAAKTDCAYQVYQFAEPSFVKCWTCVVLGQDTFKSGVFLFNSNHSIIYQLANCGLLGIGLQVVPASLLWPPRRHFPPDIRLYLLDQRIVP